MHFYAILACFFKLCLFEYMEVAVVLLKTLNILIVLLKKGVFTLLLGNITTSVNPLISLWNDNPKRNMQ